MSAALKIVKRLYLSNYTETYITDLAFGLSGNDLIEFIKKNSQNATLQNQFRVASKNFYLDILFNVWSTGSKDRYGVLSEDQIFNLLKKSGKQYFNYKFDPDSMHKLFQKAQMFLGQTEFKVAFARFLEFYQEQMKIGDISENVEDYKTQRADKNRIKSQIINPSGGLSEAKKKELANITEAIVTRRQSIAQDFTPRENEKTTLDPIDDQPASKLKTGTFLSDWINNLWSEVIKRKETYDDERVVPDEEYIHLLLALIDVYNSYTKKNKMILPVNNYGYTYDKANKVYVFNLKDPGGVYLFEIFKYLTGKELSSSQINLSVVCSESNFTRRHKQYYYDTVLKDAGGPEAIPSSSEGAGVLSQKLKAAAEETKLKEELKKLKELDELMEDFKKRIPTIESLASLNHEKERIVRRLNEFNKLKLPEDVKTKKSLEYDKIQIELNDRELRIIERESKPPITPDRVPSDVNLTPTKIVEMKANDEQHDIAEMKRAIDRLISYGEEILNEMKINPDYGKIKTKMSVFNNDVKNYKKQIRANYDQVKSNIPEGKIRNELLGNWGTLSNLLDAMGQRMQEIDWTTDKQSLQKFTDTRIEAVLRTPSSKVFAVPATPKSALRTMSARKPVVNTPEISPSNPNTQLTPSDFREAPATPVNKARPSTVSRYQQMTMEDFYNVYLKPIFKNDFATFLQRAKDIRENGDGYKQEAYINGTIQATEKFVEFIFNDRNNPKDIAMRNAFKVSSILINQHDLPRVINFIGHVFNEPIEQRRLKFLQYVLDKQKGPSTLLSRIGQKDDIIPRLAKQIDFIDNPIIIPEFQKLKSALDIKPGKYNAKSEYSFDKDKPIEYDGALIPLPTINDWVVVARSKYDTSIERDNIRFRGSEGFPDFARPWGIENYYLPKDWRLRIPEELRNTNAPKQLLLLTGPERSMELSKPSSMDTDESTSTQPKPPTQRFLELDEPLAIMAKETDEVLRIENELVPYVADDNDNDNDWEIGEPEYRYEYVDETKQENTRGPKIVEESSEQWKPKKYTKKIPDGVMRLWLVEKQVFVDIRLF